MAAAVQSAAGWIHELARGKPTPTEEPSTLDAACDTEFKADFAELFQEPLRTLPSVGPPTLLAYRPESSWENTGIEAEEDSAPRCEYCGSPLKPFPPLEGACPPRDHGSAFCCQRSRDLYEFIVNERKIHNGARSVPSAAGPRGSHGTGANMPPSEERAFQRQQERRVGRQLAFLAAEPTSTAERSHHAGTISYLLSREPPSPTGRTLVPAARAAKPEEEEEPVSCCDFAPVGGKSQVKKELLEKYYSHGGKFLITLPDGMAQLFYPSGHLAVTVVREGSRLACVVQEDKRRNAEIRAVFSSSGRGACYYPSGAVWINVSSQGGQCLDRAGRRVRRWMWPSSVASPGPRVPLRPIFLSLNRHVGVRILGQDRVTVSFLAMGQQAKFNVGTKVQVSGGQLPPPARLLGEDELVLLALRVRILRLCDRLRQRLRFPSSERDRTEPAYLTSQSAKLLRLCATPDSSDKLRSWVRAIVNAGL